MHTRTHPTHTHTHTHTPQAIRRARNPYRKGDLVVWSGVHEGEVMSVRARVAKIKWKNFLQTSEISVDDNRLRLKQ